MRSKTKQLIGVVTVAGAILGAGSAVFAHGGYGPGWTGPAWSGHHGAMGAYGGMRGHYPGPGAMMGGMPGGMMRGMPGAMMGGDPVAATSEHLAGLKQTLGITAEQESVWNAYADAKRGMAKVMSDHGQRMHGAVRGGIDTDQHIEMMQEGTKQMNQLATATGKLYAALNPDQKSVSDQWLGGHGGPCRTQ